MRATASPADGMASRSGVSSEQDDSRSSSTDSPAPADNEESDFFLAANDSQSSLGFVNFQDMQVEDSCWPPVNRLPNEILISIFARLNSPSDLYHCMLVSKRWTRNAVDLLWHRPACNNWSSHQSICQTLALDRPFFNYRDFIKRLNLAALADKVNDGSVSPLAVCTRVERLTLTNCRGLTDAGLVALVENNASLLALDVSNDKNITETSIYVIAEHCKRLQGLNVSGCELISNESMITLAENCRFIKRLKLNDCVQLRDNAVHAFAENCPNILEIDLHACSHIGNGPVTSLLAKGTCLRELRLAYCSLVDDAAFLSLPPGRKFEHLRILDLTCCARLTDAAVRKIIDVAPRLRNLVLAKCRNITDAAVQAIASLGKNLHYVHLGHCAQITDEGVKTLVASCNRIRYIDLGCCTHLTDESVKRLAVLPKLKRIGLVKCSNITDESVFTLADVATRPRVRRDANGLFLGGEYYTSSLERVHLSYCVNLTLKSIMKLLNSCPRLTHLSLTGVAAFQRDDFQPYCRPAPPEFTPHQRDVFCVFSGHMVSKFRDFLNTSAQFEELRESLTPRPHGRVRTHQSSRPPATASAMPTAFDETYDDEMGDDENDFEGVYPNDMFMHHLNNGNQFLHSNNLQDPANMPTMAHSLPTLPAAANLIGQHLLTLNQPAASTQQQQQVTLPSLSSFMNNEPAVGDPPLSAYGLSQASTAGAAQTGSHQASTANAGNSTSASTAPMHQQQDEAHAQEMDS